MKKTNCFAYTKDKKFTNNCTATTRENCDKCPFFKTLKQFDREAKKCQINVI